MSVHVKGLGVHTCVLQAVEIRSRGMLISRGRHGATPQPRPMTLYRAYSTSTLVASSASSKEIADILRDRETECNRRLMHIDDTLMIVRPYTRSRLPTTVVAKQCAFSLPYYFRMTFLRARRHRTCTDHHS